MTNYKILHLAGSCRSGNDKTGTISHAVLSGVSICGKSPNGRSAGWSEWADEKVTCPKCLNKLMAKG